MFAKDIHAIIDTLFPEKFQEKYDNSGGQIIFHDEKIENILISLDIDEHIIAEAYNKNCNLIITHHPVLFTGIKRIDSTENRSRSIISCINNKISVYAIHTNLDKFYHTKLSDYLDFNHENLLFTTDITDSGNRIGFGNIASLKKALVLQQLLSQIKEKLQLDFLTYCGDEQALIKRVAILNGAGGRQVESIIIQQNVDCIITGDVKYHEMQYAKDSGISVVDIGHYGSEKILLFFLQTELQDCLTKNKEHTDIQIYLSESEKNPYKLF